MESNVLSTTYYPVVKEVFKHLEEEALVNCYNVSQDFRYFAKDWEKISTTQKLSENFIREFHDRVDWSYISAIQKLSEAFIREFHDRVGWYFISAYQNISENFREEFQDKFDWKNILGISTADF